MLSSIFENINLSTLLDDDKVDYILNEYNGIVVNGDAPEDKRLPSVIDNLPYVLMKTCLIHEVLVSNKSLYSRHSPDHRLIDDVEPLPTIKAYIYEMPDEYRVFSNVRYNPGPVLGIAHVDLDENGHYRELPQALMKTNASHVPVVFDGATDTLDDMDIAVAMMFYGSWYEYLEDVWWYGRGPYPSHSRALTVWYLSQLGSFDYGNGEDDYTIIFDPLDDPAHPRPNDDYPRPQTVMDRATGKTLSLHRKFKFKFKHILKYLTSNKKARNKRKNK